MKDQWRNALADAPISDKVRNALLKWNSIKEKPYSGSNFEQWLDTITYKTLLEEHLGLDPSATAYVDPILASGVGLGSDVVSAYAAYAIDMPGANAWHESPLITSRDSFPGGNSGFARHFMKAIRPDAISGGTSFEDIIDGRIEFNVLDDARKPIRMRLRSTVIDVRHVGEVESSDYVRIV